MEAEADGPDPGVDDVLSNAADDPENGAKDLADSMGAPAHGAGDLAD